MTRRKSDSLWYARYVGDYRRKTQHLSMLEHGAYTLLLDYYYSTRRAPDANASVLHRVCMAFAPEEQQAVQRVLEEFFYLEDGKWKHERAEEELAKRREISKKRSQAAKDRWSDDDANASASEHANGDASAYAKRDTATATARILSSSSSARASPSDLFDRVWEAADIGKLVPVPSHWVGPAAQLHVHRWVNDLGLSESEIIGVIDACRERHPDPPNGPKAFDRAMQRLAAEKARDPMQPTEGPSDARRYPPRDAAERRNAAWDEAATIYEGRYGAVEGGGG
ncbi:MAG: YdaU family protein [Pseudomonadota bacterium]